MQSRLFRTTVAITLKVVLTAALFAHTGGAAAQQDPPSGPPPSGGHHGRPTPTMELERIARAMEQQAVPLADTQKTTILGILQDRDTAIKALRKGNSSPQDQETQRRQLMDTSNAAIRAVLSEAQARVFDVMASGPPQGTPPSGAPPSGGGSASADTLIDANTGGDPHTVL